MLKLLALCIFVGSALANYEFAGFYEYPVPEYIKAAPAPYPTLPHAYFSKSASPSALPIYHIEYPAPQQYLKEAPTQIPVQATYRKETPTQIPVQATYQKQAPTQPTYQKETNQQQSTFHKEAPAKPAQQKEAPTQATYSKETSAATAQPKDASKPQLLAYLKEAPAPTTQQQKDTLAHQQQYDKETQAPAAQALQKEAASPASTPSAAYKTEYPTAHAKQPIDFYVKPKYQFNYDVDDCHTGDKKSHHEERDGEQTKGQYSVHQPDGTILTVDYAVAGKGGFNAVVTKSGKVFHSPSAPIKSVVAHVPIYCKGC